MPIARLLRSVPVVRTPRVMQLEGMFDLPPSERSDRKWDVVLPIESREWQIGLIVGPSGSGKTTIAREIFGDAVLQPFDWPADRAVIDAFPPSLSIKETTALLSSVGFSSPPAWLRPFRCLSNGEQFRCTLARGLAERRPLTVVDEFTSVVDRTVARIGSAAVASAVRRLGTRFVAVSCHDDVESWLNPNWVYQADLNQFRWRSLQPRPVVELSVRRTDKRAWRRFGHHHYLAASLSPSSTCCVGTVDQREAVLTAVISWPHPRRPGWREHRTVCLPDYQGIGIGNGMSDLIAGVYRATGRPYRSVTSAPAMIHHRAKSPRWHMTRRPGRITSPPALASLRRSTSTHRMTASFEYVGPPLEREARRLGIVSKG